MLVLLMVIGCGESKSPTVPFSSGGEQVLPTYDTSANTDDSGSTDTAVDEAAPVITDVSLVFDSYPNFGYVVEGRITYADAQDDVEGGHLYYDVTEGTGSPESFSLSVVSEANLSGSEQAYIDSNTGEIVFAFLADVDLDYSVDAIVLQDSANNNSAEESGTVAAGSYTGP